MRRLILIVLIIVVSHTIQAQEETKFIQDKIWKLEHTIINNEDYFFKLDDRKAPTIRMKNGKIRGFSGCNSYTGSYSATNRTISLIGRRRSQMKCAEGIPELPESEYVKAITNNFTLDVDMYHGSMTLYVEGGDYFHFVLFSEKPTR